MKSILANGLGLLAAASVALGAGNYAGNALRTTVTPNRVTCFLEQGAAVRIEIMATDIVRVRFDPKGAFTTQSTAVTVLPAPPFTIPLARINDYGAFATIRAPKFTVIVYKYPFRMDILRPDDAPILNDGTQYSFGWDSDTGSAFTQKISALSEYYLGFGFRGGPVNRRSRSFVMRNTGASAYGEYTDPLQISIPFYYGFRGGKAYGVFVDNAATPFFDVGVRQPGLVSFGVSQGELDYYVMIGPEPRDVANAYARLTGLAALPPRWSLGYHQSRYGYKSAEEITGIATQFRALGIPCDVLHLDLDYMDQLHTLTWDPVRFPDPAGFNANLDQMGFKRVNIVDPVVRTDDPLWPAFAAGGYFLTDASNHPAIMNMFIGEVSWIDFTNTALRNWYSDRLKGFLEVGVSGIWNDLNEPEVQFPWAIYDFNGEKRPDILARNLYALKQTSLSRETMKAARPNVRPWVLSRSGFAGIQRYAANWSGDTNSSFESLRTSISLSLSMGLSGQAQFGHDVGGFLGTPSPELYIRWLEFGSFEPLFRTHSVDTSDPREPWQFDEPYRTMARDIIRNRYRFLPYLYTLVESASRSGSPVIAPTPFYFPYDERTYLQDYEFMLGPSLLVAPVYEQGATTRAVYLPSGTDWFDFYTGRQYAGGQTVTVDAPLETIPLFIVAGAVLPLGPDIQYTGDTSSTAMSVQLLPAASSSSFVLYEDDGTSNDFQKDIFRRTKLSQAPEPGGIRFTIERQQGTWNPPDRTWTAIVRAQAKPPAEVRLNASVLPMADSKDALEATPGSWFYSPQEQSLYVRMNDSASALNIQIRN